MSGGNARLAGKVAIVTGAGDRGRVTGIGHAIAVLFAREGSKVLLVDQDLDNAQRTLAVIEGEGSTASVCQADVTNEADCANMIAAAVARYGALHVLVNNVGTSGRKMVTEVDEALLDCALDLGRDAAGGCRSVRRHPLSVLDNLLE